VALAYFAAAVLAITLTGQAGNVAALWFAGAVLLAALLRHEPPAWPALLLLCWVADVASNLLNGGRLPVALAVASADILEVLLAAAALRRLAGDGPRLVSAGWMGLFALAALLAPVPAAALGAGLLALLGEAPFAATWGFWYAADALGPADRHPRSCSAGATRSCGPGARPAPRARPSCSAASCSRSPCSSSPGGTTPTCS
jgi:integral membrane sensor domain MASE1